jgi:hypothetical protein
MRFATLTLSALLFAAGTAAASGDLTIVSKHTLNGKPDMAVTITIYLTGRTIVRRGPERSFELFEAFDELFVLCWR